VLIAMLALRAVPATAGMEVDMTSSTMTPTLGRVGVPGPARMAGAMQPELPVHPARSLEDEAAAFVRAAHRSRWRALLPMLISLLFGVALVLVGVITAPSPTLQRMSAAGAESTGVAASRTDAVGGYQLPSYWQWPALGNSPASGERVACDPASTGSAC